MKNKTIWVVLALLVLAIVPFALAEETTTATQTTTTEDVLVPTATDVADAGTNPDSPMWGIDRALEKISLAMTFGSENKVAKGLEIAKERLLEIKVMAQRGNVDAAEKAQKEYNNEMEKVKENIAKINDADSTEKLKKTIEAEVRVRMEKETADKVTANLEQIKERSATEARERLSKVKDDVTSETASVETAVNEKKDKVEVEHKAKTEKTDEEIEDEETEIEDEVEKEINHGMIQSATVHIRNAERKINDAKELLGNTTSEYLTAAESELVNAKEAFAANSTIEAKDYAKMAFNNAIKAMHDFEETADKEKELNEEREHNAPAENESENQEETELGENEEIQGQQGPNAGPNN